MSFVVCHLTRMEPGYLCVAGLDTETNRSVRPEPAAGRLERSALIRHGGLFDMGAVVDLGATTSLGRAPRVEDRMFAPRNAKYLHDMAADEFWALLARGSRPTFRDIFGPAFYQKDASGVLELHKGRASLGCIRLAEPPNLFVNSYHKIRMDVTDGEFRFHLTVTDLRLHEEDHVTPRRKVVMEVARRIQQGTPVLLAVGLTRPWQKDGDTVPRHWLQVNNLHLEDNPLWTERP